MGSGGHFLLIVPECGMVIVHRVNTFAGTRQVLARDSGKLIKMIIEARVE